MLKYFQLVFADVKNVLRFAFRFKATLLNGNDCPIV
jgi:hypothetical protein